MVLFGKFEIWLWSEYGFHKLVGVIQLWVRILISKPSYGEQLWLYSCVNFDNLVVDGFLQKSKPRL